MKEALLDTDILSFFFKGDEKVTEKVTEYLQEYDQINMPIITYYEIIGGLKFKNLLNQISDFERFIENNSVINVSEKSAKISAKIYADLRQKRITIETSDILIAGIAIENDLILITNNEKHYMSVKNLKIENWKRT